MSTGATGATGPTGAGGTGAAAATSTPATVDKKTEAKIDEKKEEVKATVTSWTAGMSGVAVIFWSVVSLLFLIVFHYGAAVLSYARYQSVFWAVIDFVFATFYYPYYALVLNQPNSAVIGGRRHRN